MINLTEAKQKELINLAYDMRKNSYCPYSGFAVGAALLAEDGRIYTGCNMENASFGAGICAERSAFAKANADGNRRFKAIAVAGGKRGCRQIIHVCHVESVCRSCRNSVTGILLFYFQTENRRTSSENILGNCCLSDLEKPFC